MCFSFPVIQNQAGCSELKTEPTCIDNQLNPPTPCRGKSDRKPIHKRQSPKESLTINCRHYNLFLMMYLRPQIRGRVRTFILGVFASLGFITQIHAARTELDLDGTWQYQNVSPLTYEGNSNPTCNRPIGNRSPQSPAAPVSPAGRTTAHCPACRL